MSLGNPNSATSPTVTNGKLLECSKVEINRASATGPVLPVRINGGSSIRDRQILIRKLGTSSTAFIGPACRPPKAVQRPLKPKKVMRRPKHNIEETLNEFYKELEEIEPKDCIEGSELKDNADGNIAVNTHNPPTAKDGFNASHDWNKPNHMPRPHWYDNQPYQPRRPIPTGPNYGPDSNGPYFQPCENHWQPPPPFHSQPYPMFLRPPHCLPPPPPIPGLPPPPPADNQYHPKPDCSQQIPPSQRFPVPDGYTKALDLGDHGFPINNSNRDGGSYSWCEDWNDQQGYHQKGSSEWQQRFNRGPEPPQQENKHQQPKDTTYNYDPSLVLILMRGAPGSGKSTRARELLSTGSSGLVLSTDDYFSRENGYLYDPSLLGKAHHWNQIRAKEVMYKCCSPVIIDNTNLQAWEMKPYVKLAMETGYSVHFHEPHTSWKFDPIELEKRNKHGVPRKKIGQMLERFELPMSLDIVMNSQEPVRPTRHSLQ